jgi:hypothetical protein
MPVKDCISFPAAYMQTIIDGFTAALNAYAIRDLA